MRSLPTHQTERQKQEQHVAPNKVQNGNSEATPFPFEHQSQIAYAQCINIDSQAKAQNHFHLSSRWLMGPSYRWFSGFLLFYFIFLPRIYTHSKRICCCAHCSLSCGGSFISLKCSDGNRRRWRRGANIIYNTQKRRALCRVYMHSNQTKANARSLATRIGNIIYIWGARL